MIEKLNGTLETVLFEKGVSLKLHNNDEAENYPMHWHLPIEIIMPVSNGYSIQCKNTRYDLREEDILFVQPGVLHECIAPPCGRRFFCQISLPAPLISSKMNAGMSLLLPPVMQITPELDKALHHEVCTLLHQTYQVDSSASFLTDFTKALSVMQIIHLVYAFFEKNAIPYEKGSTLKMEIFTQLQQACHDIFESYAEDLSLDSIARKIGFSKYHFARLFKAHTGKSFYRYLNSVRMSNAQSMLTDPDISITAIAYSVGYTSMSSFIRMFKDFYGCTPSHYRRMLEAK